MSVQVKICGICRPLDAERASEAGADYIGVILSRAGVRHRSEHEAAAIFAAGSTRRAGVFVDEPLESVLRLSRRLSLDVIQLHGAEDLRYVQAVRCEGPWQVWKALRVGEAREAESSLDRYADVVDALLLDRPRGGGERGPLEWRMLAGLLAARRGGPPIWIAGGLRADNVASAVGLLRPDGVDVSSGVESGPGEKSAEAIVAFVSAARRGADGSEPVTPGEAHSLVRTSDERQHG